MVRNFVSLLLLCLCIFYLLPIQTEAAFFTNSYIRLDRQKKATSTTGLICAKTATTATENKVLITFPSTFTVDPTASNWTVSTTNLPSGSSPLPGINTAIAVSGKTVTFPSNDLSTGTLYCFNWSNTSLTNPPSAGNYTATITTQTITSSTIDSSSVGLAVTDNDQVNVNAQVLVNSTDINLDLSGVPSGGSTVSNNGQIDFTVTYESFLPFSIPLTIETSWDKGTIISNGQTIDMYQYVIGSASNADDGTVPIIDTNNRTITWNIPALSSGSSHTVTFSLKVLSNFTVGLTANANVQTTARFSGNVLQTKQLTYSTNGVIALPTATPTPTPGPTTTPVPGLNGSQTPTITGVTNTPTPTINPSIPLKITNVTTTELLQNQAQIYFETNKPTNFAVTYGDSKDDLVNSISDNNYVYMHSFTLNNLEPNKIYFYRITATDQNGKSITSDIFTFHTPSKTVDVSLDKPNIIIWSDQIRLTSDDTNVILLPISKKITLNITVSNYNEVAEIDAEFRNNKVLGAESTKPAQSSSKMIQLFPGKFSVELTSPDSPGDYSIVITVKDVYGSQYTKIVPFKILVSQPITIIDAETKQPVRRATILFSKYDTVSKRFIPMDQGFILNKFTDRDGYFTIALPDGEYQLRITAPGYDTKDTHIELGQNQLQYSIITLSPTKNIEATVIRSSTTVLNGLEDIYNTIFNFIKVVIISQGSLYTDTWIIIFFAFLFSSLRAHLELSILIWQPFRSMIARIWGHIGLLQEYSIIKVIDKNNNLPISGVQLYIVDNKQRLLVTDKTNVRGKAYISLQKLKKATHPLHIFMVRTGYLTRMEAYPLTTHRFNMWISKDKRTRSPGTFAQFLFDDTITMLSYLFLLLSILAVTYTTISIGFIKTIPAIIVVIFLVMIWSFSENSRWKSKSTHHIHDTI